jgi:hypothetical protein
LLPSLLLLLPHHNATKQIQLRSAASCSKLAPLLQTSQLAAGHHLNKTAQAADIAAASPLHTAHAAGIAAAHPQHISGPQAQHPAYCISISTSTKSVLKGQIMLLLPWL